MSISSVEADKLMVPDILEKVYRYGVTRETAQKVVLGTWPGTDRAGAERLAQAANRSEDALAAFWRVTLPAPFLALQHTKASVLYIVLAHLGFRPEIVDDVELGVYGDGHAQSLLEWGVMVAKQEARLAQLCDVGAQGKAGGANWSR